MINNQKPQSDIFERRLWKGYMHINYTKKEFLRIGKCIEIPTNFWGSSWALYYQSKPDLQVELQSISNENGQSDQVGQGDKGPEWYSAWVESKIILFDGSSKVVILKSIKVK